MATGERESSLIVTGGSGLIGSSVVERLADGYHIFALDRAKPPSEWPAGAEYIEIDVASDTSVNAALRTVNKRRTGPIASVIHLAAYHDFSGRPSELYEEVTVRGTQRILRGVQEMPVEQFLFSSTMLVHRSTEPGRPITEDSALDDSWDHPRSKIEAERVVHEDRGSIPAVLLRIAGVYTDTCDSIPLSHQIRRIYEQRMTGYFYPGDASHGQAFAHLEDTVEAIRQAVERRKELPAETAILIGEPETFSYDRLQRELARLIHGDTDWQTQEISKAFACYGAWVQRQVLGSDDPFIQPHMIELAGAHYELDISRARQLLGWEPRHRLIDTLPKMIESLKAAPLAWYKRHGLKPTYEMRMRAEAGGTEVGKGVR
jgi:nucleoside-diphosphate-sugar epimerase